jgi:hypothetical protein
VYAFEDLERAPEIRRAIACRQLLYALPGPVALDCAAEYGDQFMLALLHL